MSGLTAQVAAFVAANTFDNVPQIAIGAIKNALSDYAAVTILGMDEETTRIVTGFEPVSKDAEARLFFSDLRAPARSAALINGTSGHAHDYDDVGIAFHPAHPSVAIAPALFAQAETQGASGRQLLCAYATAYEVWSELASRDSQPHHLRGFHPTGYFGTIAAAAGAANLMQLNAQQTSNALAIAASQAAGLVANFGSMTKPFHAGRAAAAGLMSARYAAGGMTASGEIFEHKHGFLRALSPEGNVDLTRACHFGKSWHLVDHGIGVKLYPLCYGNHRIIHTLTQYVSRNDLPADAISSVSYRTAPSRVVALVHTDPKTPLDAKFSAEFAIAMSVIAKQATLSELTDDFFNRDDVHTLMSKVQRELDPAREAKIYNGEPDDELVFAMNNGTNLVLPLESPPDLAINLDKDVLWTKFLDCTNRVMTKNQASALFDGLQNLQECQDIRALPGYRAMA